MSETAQPEVAAEAPEVAAPMPGAILLEERQRQALSLTDVARQLKLFPRQVEALERDDYKALPGPVFVRGFTRNYARLLGIDAEPLLRAVESRLAPGKAEAAPEPGPVHRPGRPAVLPSTDGGAAGGRGRMPLYVVSAVIILVTAYVATRDRTPEPGPVDVPVAVTPAEAPATPSAPVPMSEAPPVPTPMPAVPTAAPATPESVPAKPMAVVPVAPDLEKATGTGPELRFTFAREAWAEVRDGKGRLIFAQLNPEGSVRIVRGTPPLSLVVGNASGVSLTFRGKAVDLAPHTRTDVARLTLE